MATPTSSSNRSKRKTNKPVTKGQEPFRSNRQKTSTAKVTDSNNRGSNTGSAKVTTGKGNTPKALPPGAKGGPLATQGRGSLKGQPQLPPGRKGGPVEKAGPTVDVKANTSKLKSGQTPKPPARPALPPGQRGGAMTRSGGGALARTASGGGGNAALRTVTKAGGGLLSRASVPLAMASEVKAMMDRDRRWNDYKERTGLNDKTPAQMGGSRRGAAAGTRTNPNAKPTRPPLSSTGVRTPRGNSVPTGSPEYNRYRQQQLDDNKRRNSLVRDTTPNRTSAPSGGGGGGGSRGGGNYSGGSTTSGSGGGGGGTRTQSSPSTSSQRPSSYRTNERGFYRGSDDYEKRLSEKNQKNYGDSSTSGNPLLDKMRRDMGRDVKTGERKATTTTAKTSSTTGPAKPAQPAAPNTKKDSKSATAVFENNRKSLENDPKATKVDTSKMERKADSKNSTPNSLRDAISDRKKKRQSTVASRIAQLRNGRMA